MKNKKGFTLIELLAVIVVLAVIALIAIPIIINVIDKAKLGALKDSAYGVLDAGELYIANNLKEEIPSVKFICSNNECISDAKKISYKGNIKSGILILNNDTTTAICVDNGKNYAVKLINEKDITTGIGTCGTYEEVNGTFEIINSSAALIEQYEAQLQEKNDTIAELETKLNDSGCLYKLGDQSLNYVANTYNLPEEVVSKGYEVYKNGKILLGDVGGVYATNLGWTPTFSINQNGTVSVWTSYHPDTRYAQIHPTSVYFYLGEIK